jgi:diguanylate cyclase (GGDEF)-like protein/PAS domain S-box-containing protein
MERTGAEIEAQAAAMQSLLDSSPQGLFAVDRAGRYTAFNQAHFRRMEAVYGVQIERGARLAEYLLVAADRTRIQANIDRALAGETFSEVGLVGGEAGRERKWIEVHHTPLRDEQGGVCGVSIRSEDVTELYRTRDDLHSSESMFQTAFLQAAVGAAQLAPDGTFLRVNPALCAMLGYSAAELAGRTLAEVTLAEDRPAKRALPAPGLPAQGLQAAGLPAAGLQAAALRYEARCVRKDGTLVWVDVSTMANCDSAGNIQYEIAYIQDITQAKRLQNELLAHKTRLDELVWERTQQLVNSEMLSHSLFENSTAMIVLLDPITRSILDVNPAACAFFGLTHEQMLKIRRSDLFDIPAADLRTYTEQIIRGEKVVFETAFTAPGGGLRHMGVQLDLVQYRQRRALLAVLHDITGYKQAEMAAQDSERRLRELVDLIPDFIWSADAAGRVDYINQPTLAYLGMSLAQALGRGWEEAVHPEDEAELERKWAAAARDGLEIEIEMRLRRHDGEYRWFLNRGQPVRDLAGQVHKWYGVVTDISDRKQAQEEMAFQSALLEQVENGVIGITFDNTVVYWNKFAEEMYQWTQAEALGKNLLELLEPVEIDEPPRKVGAADGRKWSAGAYTVRRKDGSSLQIDVNNSYLRDQKGGLIGFIPVSQDTTERRRLEAAAADRVRLIEQLAAQSPGVLFQLRRRLDGSYCLPYCSEALRAIFQTAPEDAREDVILIAEAVAAADQAELAVKVEESARGLTPFQAEFRICLPAGTPRWMWVTARPEDLGDAGVLWSGFCADITDRKRLEDQARLNEEKWRGVFDLLPVGVAVVDANNRISDSNQAFAHILGLSVGEVESGAYLNHKYLHPDLRPMMVGDSPSARALREQAVVRDMEIGISREDGDVLWTSISAAPLPSGQGAALVMVDIRGRKELETALRERVKDLTCLHEFGRLVESQTLSAAEVCQGLVGSLALAMHIPDETTVEVELDGARFRAGPPDGAGRMETTALVTAKGRERGRLRLFAPVHRAEPQASKQILLDNLAATLGFWLERREAEAELRKLITAVEQSQASILITDLSGNIEYVNPCLCDLSGYTPEELLGKTPGIFQSGYTSRAEYNDLWETITAGRVWRGEFRNRKKNGEYFWEKAVISPVVGKDGAITHFLAVKEDISERKQDTARIEEALAFNQTIVDSAPIGIMIFAAAGDCISANQAAGAIVGTEPANLLRQNIHTIASWKPSGLYAAAVQAQQSGQVVFTQAHLYSSFGKEMWVNARFVTFKAGGTSNLLLMFEDDSDRQLAQTDLQISHSKLTRMVADLETRNAQADLLRQMSDLLQVCATGDEARVVVDQYAPRVFVDCRGGVYMLAGTPGSLAAISTWGAGLASEAGFASDACWALRRGQSYLYDSAGAGVRCRHVSRAFRGMYLDVPLSAGGETLGLLHLEWEPQAAGAGGEETHPAASADTEAPAGAPAGGLLGGQRSMRELTQLFADTISLSFSNIRLRETLHDQSVRDPLTRAFNRRYMEETLDRELPRTRRKNGHTALIMLDIDHFKKFNDSFGHAAGDLILTRLTRLLQANVRGEDVVCRLGGEEFVMILPEANGEVAAARAEGIRAEVAAMNNAYEGGQLGTVTVSIGVAIFPQNGSARVELMHKADMALYKAKKNGRNRVEVFTEGEG